MIWIKICGITSPADALAALDAGVSAIGLIFAPSPRQVTQTQALEIAACVRDHAEIVGVFKDASLVPAAHAAVHFDRIQIHSDAPVECDVPVMRALRPDALSQNITLREGDMTLIDGSEGRGLAFDWMRARPMPGRVVIAGGLTPENVGEAIAWLHPFGVDVSSGVERAPGLKDPRKMTRFVEAARRADGAR